MRGAVRALALVLGLGAGPAAAQEAAAVPKAPILTLDQDRLFAASAFGKRALADLETAQAALLAENREIEAQLMAEERALTERRATMTAEAFAPLAEEFDRRVTAFRSAQDAKSRDLLKKRDEERQRFLQAAVPILGELMQQAGAVAILSEEAIVLAFGGIDITDAAIARLDAVLGPGAAPATPMPDPAPDAAPEPAPEPAPQQAPGTAP